MMRSLLLGGTVVASSWVIESRLERMPVLNFNVTSKHEEPMTLSLRLYNRHMTDLHCQVELWIKNTKMTSTAHMNRVIEDEMKNNNVLEPVCTRVLAMNRPFTVSSKTLTQTLTLSTKFNITDEAHFNQVFGSIRDTADQLDVQVRVWVKVFPGLWCSQWIRAREILDPLFCPKP